MSDSLIKISDKLRGPLASLGGPLTSERGHWAFSENEKILQVPSSGNNFPSI